MKGLISAAIAGVFSLIFAISFWPLASVPVGHMGVVTVFGKVQDRALEPGLNWVGFMAHSRDLNIQQQSFSYKATAGTKDLQTVHATVTVNLHPSASSIVQLYSEIGADYSEKLVDPAVHDRIKAATAHYTAEELIILRSKVVDEVRTGITELVKARSNGRVLIDSVVITDFAFEGAFQNAILAKQVSEQNAQKAKYDLEKAQIDARQRVAVAEAEARAFQVQSQQLTTQMLQMEWIKKWDGSLPQYMIGGGSSSQVLMIPGASKKAE